MKKNFPFDVYLDPINALIHIDKDETHQTFMLARASAIEQYAYLEQILCTLCAHLMDVPIDVAGVMFFRMNNAKARLDSLERLLHKKHGNTYNLFWNSLVKYIRPIDQKRNLIVHWIPEKTLSDRGRWSCLVGLNFWDKRENPEKIYLNDLYNFSLACNFFYHLIQHFIWVISGSKKVIHPSWPDICKQLIVYPPPATHPLYKN